MENDVSSHKSRASEMEHDLSLAMKKISIISKKYAELESETENLSSDLDKATKAMKGYERKIAEVKSDSSPLLAVSDNKINELLREKTSLCADLNEKLKMLEKLKTREEKNQEKIAVYERKFQASNENIESLRNNFEEQVSSNFSYRLHHKNPLIFHHDYFQLRKLHNDKKELKEQKKDLELEIQAKLLENDEQVSSYSP